MKKFLELVNPPIKNLKHCIRVSKSIRLTVKMCAWIVKIRVHKTGDISVIREISGFLYLQRANSHCGKTLRTAGLCTTIATSSWWPHRIEPEKRALISLAGERRKTKKGWPTVWNRNSWCCKQITARASLESSCLLVRFFLSASLFLERTLHAVREFLWDRFFVLLLLTSGDLQTI